MAEVELANAVQLLDLMLEFFADDGHWTRGCYDDGNGGHCLVGALLHLGRRHRLPTAPVIALLQDAMPWPGVPLVHFNDSRCGSVAELRSVILKARRLAHDDAERARAAAAMKTWLLAQIEKTPTAAAADSTRAMPARDPAKRLPAWLTEGNANVPRVKPLLAPYPSDEMTAWPVSARVGNVRNNDASLIEPLAAAAAH
jgi:hypothetical protein